MANYILLFCLLTDDRKMCEFGSCGDEYDLYFCIQFISCVILSLDPAALNPGDVNGVGGGRHDIKMFQ